MQKVDRETNCQPWRWSKKLREMNAWRDYIPHEIHLLQELDADFNFWNIHLISHWAKQIRRYGALQQYAAMRHNQAYKTNRKDS
jgi:hypothetical protein